MCFFSKLILKLVAYQRKPCIILLASIPLSLFAFSMLGIVLANNLIQIFVFWELVGVSSFLLIGFYWEKPSAVAAAIRSAAITATSSSIASIFTNRMP